MEMVGIASPLTHKRAQNIPITTLLKLNKTLKKSLLSRKFYQEINDKVLASTSSLDACLYFICYFTLLLSSVLNNKQKILAFVNTQKTNLIRVINTFFLKASNKHSLPRADRYEASSVESEKYEGTNESEKNECTNESEKPVINTENPVTQTGPTPNSASKLAVHLKAVSSYISDYRIFNRLVEAIKYMPWIIDEFSALVNPVSAVPLLDRLVNLAQALNCLVLELLENVGWLSEHNWIGTNNNDYWSMETYIWSSRVWGAYIAVEIIELLRRYPASKRDKDWRIKLFTQAVQVPLVVHWSLYDGCLSPFWVGVCGSAASWFGFKNVLDSIDLS
ncbi:hypothetical protein JCM33374_g5892 [Metschnikowia sp. JCM 33374]|nr:hypothetical protein JCM33374_g5892 [Metschnikowia sp. JCM 33374]